MTSNHWSINFNKKWTLQTKKYLTQRKFEEKILSANNKNKKNKENLQFWIKAKIRW